MFHDQRRFMVNIGNQTITMNKAELRDVYQKENDGAMVKIISLKLTTACTQETYFRSTLRQNCGKPWVSLAAKGKATRHC